MNLLLQPAGHVGWAVAAVALLAGAAHLCGRLLIPTFSRGLKGWLERQALRVAIGFNLLSFAGMTLGMLRLHGGGRATWLLAAAGAWSIVLLCRERQFSTWPARFQLNWLGGGFLAIVLITLGPALSYPTGWDELVYHQELPRRWQADGWPALYPDLPYSGFPSLGEILFWLMTPLDGVIAPRLLTWLCWILGLFFVYRLLRRHLAAPAAGALMGAFALSSTLLLVSANCYVETIQMINFGGMLLVMEQRRVCSGREAWRQAAVVGVLGGGAVAVKLTGIAVLAVPCLWYAVETLRDRRRVLRQVHLLGACLLVAVAVALPFYLRPWLLTGDPFYPYYARWFTDNAAWLEMSDYHHALGSAFGVHGPGAFFFAPVLLAFDYDIFDGDFGWQLVLVLGLAALAMGGVSRRRGYFLLLPGAASAVLYAFWFSTAQQARFAIPSVMGLLMLAAVGLQAVRGAQRNWVLAVLIIATAASLPWRTSGQYLGSWLAVLHLIRNEDYVKVLAGEDYFSLITGIEEHTPPDAKLMLLFEHRGCYLPRQHKIGTPFFQEAVFTPPESFSDCSRVMEVLARERITHVVITDRPRGPDVAAAWRERLDPFLAGVQECLNQGRLHPIWESDRYALLEVVGATEPAPAGSP